jgi:hypothetical protein
MTEINTFSAAVDDTIARAGRPDRKADVISFVRTSIRELQVQHFFQRDFVEDQINATADPFVWDVPDGTFRRMWTVRYPNQLDSRAQAIYPRPVRPSRAHRGKDYFYYRSGDSYVFKGHGASATLPQPIDIAYHAYLIKLQYYDLTVTGTERPAIFVLEDNAWTYASAYSTTDALKAQARDLVTNWLLFDWYDAVVEGAMAKLLKVTGDERAVSSFALFSSFKKDLLLGETRSVQGGEI